MAESLYNLRDCYDVLVISSLASFCADSDFTFSCFGVDTYCSGTLVQLFTECLVN
jgi:hypothetical protein